ncbi:AAA family ATPase [Salipaludibacillus aurantiacus]|uniref:Nuclease SbcCD subunit C n=1 Tax=Salipaludibacillus aurantiacus TaxID=1601833 RepID=A0A1H9U1K0_9BACI|nr:AAA family ATPase [Salipaludibacillus aurantiacus]SES03172.1 AAA domain-containing protein [Salipaludibacillus aurantiacus]
MKTLKLQSLLLKNFKGVESFLLEAKGEDVQILGDNATGKSTLFDAMTWLLFDKDSHNKKDFAIKTLDEAGDEIHGLDHEVSAVFLVDGLPLTLRKTFKEKWTKKRGSAHKEFTGHTTDYHIDDVPAKLKDFKEKVAEIVDEDAFKLLTNPAYFNEQMNWKDCRKVLLEVCGDVSDQDVIASDNKLSKLSDLLSNKTIDDVKKMVAEQKKEINKQLDMIPVRIDEIKHNLPDVSELDESQLNVDLKRYDQNLQEKEDEITRIRNGAEVTERQKHLTQLQSELIEIKNNHNSDTYDEIMQREKHFYELKSKRDDTELKVTQMQRTIRNTKAAIDEETERKQRLLNDYHSENEREFEHHHDDNCPTCGQDLPEEQVKEAHEKALADFNKKKSERLESIKNKGLQIKEYIERMQGEIQHHESDLTDHKKSLDQYSTQIDDVTTKIQGLKSNTTKVEETDAYKAKQDEIDKIKDEIDQLKASVNESLEKAQNELLELKASKREKEQELSKFEQHRQSEKRIKELADQERELAKKYEELEEKLYLTEEFTRQKVSMLEEKINSKFKYARFKLFENQINDGLKETCETLYEGVPYGKGLNTGHSIIVGLDIIQTLSEHYGFQAPIFIDNAESVTNLPVMDAQLISLVVSESDKKLRIEQVTQKEAV